MASGLAHAAPTGPVVKATQAGAKKGVVKPNEIGVIPPIVFVSRAIPATGGSNYLLTAKDMPGVGPHSRFDASSPGKLIIRESDGTQRVLIDGTKPKVASLQLADVNAPDVSYDGTRIVFAGLVKGAVTTRLGAEGYAGAWRIYVINVDGTGLQRLTFDEADREQRMAARNLPTALLPIDDGDPAWLPSGDIVFSSTRYPGFAQYGNVRTTNLYTMRPDGTDLRRITSERNGADRPIVDPATGKIVYARWWRNYRFPTNSTDTITDDVNGGYIQKGGLTSVAIGGDPDVSGMDRNAWHAAAINPNGSQLTKWSGVNRDDAANAFYGGSFDGSGQLLSNFFPILDMTDAGGFGGIRRLKRGAGASSSVIGVTNITTDPNLLVEPGSLGVYKLGVGGVANYYASDAAVLPDGRVVVSLATDINQDYGLYVMNADGSGVEPLLDIAGSSELRSMVVQPRPLPLAVRPAHSGTILALLPPLEEGPYDESGVYIFDARNVFFNAPVDTDIVNAPAVGSVSTIRFFIDHQRQSTGSFPNLDWPVEVAPPGVISPQGRIRSPGTPAGVPLFEQLRSPDGKVVLTGGNGTAHVAGMNYGVRNIVNKCVGCHAGHTLIEVPASQDAFQFTNLAPGATVTVSSTRDAATNIGLIDRKVQKGELPAYWSSAPGLTTGQWAKLHFLVPVRVRTVRLYNPRQSGGGRSTIQITGATVELCSDNDCNTVIGTSTVGNLSETGTDVAFPNVKARAVRVKIDSLTGTYLGLNVASLAEIEVIARGEAP